MGIFNQDTEGLTFSISKGIQVPFLYKGQQIVLTNSSWTPREQIFVNDERVLNRWSFAMTSTNTIDVAGEKMTLTYGYKDKMAEYFMEAKVNGEVVHKVSHTILKPEKLEEIKARRKQHWSIKLLRFALYFGLGYGTAMLIGNLF